MTQVSTNYPERKAPAGSAPKDPSLPEPSGAHPQQIIAPDILRAGIFAGSM